VAYAPAEAAAEPGVELAAALFDAAITALEHEPAASATETADAAEDALADRHGGATVRTRVPT